MSFSGRNLRELRVEAEMIQVNFAEAVGVTR